MDSNPSLKNTVAPERLIEILVEVNEQLTEEIEYKDKRIKLLEDELHKTKERNLKLASSFDVKRFKNEQ